MPIGFDPNATLKTEVKSLPGAKITVRHLTSRQVAECERLSSASARAETETEANAQIDQALTTIVAGWEGVADHAGRAVAFVAPDVWGEFSLPGKYRLFFELIAAASFGRADQGN